MKFNYTIKVISVSCTFYGPQSAEQSSSVLQLYTKQTLLYKLSQAKPNEMLISDWGI